MVKVVFLPIFLSIICQLSSAQSNYKIDSLLLELKTAGTDTLKVKVLHQLGQKWAGRKDKTTSIHYFNEAVTLAQNISFSKGEARARLELGILHSGQRNYTEALENLKAAIQLYQKINDASGEGAGFIAIGIVHKNMGNYPEALQNQLQALEILEKINDKSGMANAYNNMAIVCKSQGNYPQALSYCNQSLALALEIKNKQLSASVYGNKGNIHAQQGIYPEALLNHTAALKIHRELGNKAGIASSYNGVGNIYAHLHNYPEALQHYQAALDIHMEMDNKIFMSVAYKNIGTIHKNLGNYDLAVDNLQRALSIKQEINDKKGTAEAYHSLGSLYYSQGRLDEAIKCQYAALSIAEEIGSKDQMMVAYQSIGLILIKQGCQLKDLNLAKEKFSAAVENYKIGLSLAKEIGSMELIIKFYETLSEAYKLLDNYPMALEFLARHMALKDSISHNENNNKLQQLRTEYEVEKAITIEKMNQDSLLNDQRLIAEREKLEMITRNIYHQQKIALLDKEKKLQQLRLEKNEADLTAQLALTQKKESDLFVQKAEASKNQEQLALLNKEKEVQELKLKKEKLTKNYFIAGLGLFLVLSFFIYRNYQSRQELKLLTLRNKIASDLHDDVGSTLSSISIFSQMAQGQSKEVIPALETIGESSRKMLDAMADIVWTIKPENDQFDKVIMRMRGFAFELLGAKKIDFEFDADDDVSNINLSMEARKNLYLIFKEATNNMVKYSEASRAKIALRGEKDKLMMVISDNGKGFDTTKEYQGNGLENMKKRAVDMGAQLWINSGSGTGTTIKLELAV